MDDAAATTIISLGDHGASLIVTARRQVTMSPDEPWFDTEITADAFPFDGTLRTVFTASDLREWGEALAGIDAGAGRVVLGGDRAAQLVIDAQPQVGGPPGRMALTVHLAPSGDDPYPTLTYLIFDVAPTWSMAGSRAAALA